MHDKPAKKKKPRGKARLIPGKCIACGARCQISCPADAIEMNDKGEPIIDVDKCIGCVKCVKICPAEALEMVFPPEEEMPLFAREELQRALDDVYKYPLREGAKDVLNRQLKAGVGDADLAELVINNPERIGMANEARHKIMHELSP